jgi:hypothetical protein
MQLKRLLKTYFPQYEVVAALDAVDICCQTGSKTTSPNLFLWSGTADGICFELFSRIEVKAPVIVITAYEHYALNALKTVPWTIFLNQLTIQSCSCDREMQDCSSSNL